MRYWIFSILLFLLPQFVQAQLSFAKRINYTQPNNISSHKPSAFDTLPKINKIGPKQIAIMSACLPGLGQIYNHKWWKTPIIYAGFAGLVYGFSFNHKIYNEYRNALHYRYDDDPTTNDNFQNYSDDNLVTLKNYYQRYRDLTIIGMAALYTLQIVDATVDAHLKTFDVSDKLSLQVKPMLYPSTNGLVGMFGIRLHYR